MIDTGLPTLSDSSRLSSGRSASIASASFVIISNRSRGVVFRQDSKAALAASTASAASAASLDATSAMTSPVAGSSTSSTAPERAARNSPPM